MDRLLAAFERPHTELLAGDPVREREAAWDRFVGRLLRHDLELVSDLDPVATVGDLEIYEVTRCSAPPADTPSVRSSHYPMLVIR
jgi:hypothetical protein